MKVPIFEKDGKTISTTKNGSEMFIHAIQARKRSAMYNSTWILVTKEEKINGYKKTVTIGLRPKVEADVVADRKAADKAIKDAEALLEASKLAKRAFESQDSDEDTKAPEGARKAPVRVSAKK